MFDLELEDLIELGIDPETTARIVKHTKERPKEWIEIRAGQLVLNQEMLNQYYGTNHDQITKVLRYLRNVRENL